LAVRRRPIGKDISENAPAENEPFFRGRMDMTQNLTKLENKLCGANHIVGGKPSRRRKIGKDPCLYLIFLPAFLYYLIFHYAPLYGLIIAFKDFNVFEGIMKSPWVGTQYFQQYLLDPYFWKIVRNTLLLNIYNLLFSFPAPIALALLMNEIKNRHFKKIVQTVSYMPYFVSTVVLCGIIVNLLASDGLINQLLKPLIHEPIQFLLRPEWFRTIYISSGIWQNTGWNSIIYLAALTTIEPALYEAAMVDGANRWQRMIYITLPGIAPTITIMFILNVGHIMSVSFEKVMLLYTGLTYETADVIATYVYRQGLVGSNFSYAAAVGMFQSVIGLLFLLAANKMSKSLSETSLW
jgi:putative aldouronate transport system permease protein